jgi:ketosteroid isomerase-like protein
VTENEISGEIPGVIGGTKPEHGFDSLIEEVRRNTGADRAEVDAAFKEYQRIAAEAAASGNWDPWADLFVDDSIYVEHHYGVIRGGDAIRTWIKSVMTGPASHMDFPVVHYAIDGDVIYSYILNRFLPQDGSQPFQFPVVTILCYAGNGRWCYEEDVYNPTEGARMMIAMQRQGGA